MKKKRSFRLPVMLNSEMSKISGGADGGGTSATPGCCDCTCQYTTNSGCANGPGTIKPN